MAVSRFEFDKLGADGGLGENTSEDRGGNVFDELELTRFEEV